MANGIYGNVHLTFCRRVTAITRLERRMGKKKEISRRRKKRKRVAPAPPTHNKVTVSRM